MCLTSGVLKLLGRASGTKEVEALAGTPAEKKKLQALQFLLLGLEFLEVLLQLFEHSLVARGQVLCQVKRIDPTRAD